MFSAPSSSEGVKAEFCTVQPLAAATTTSANVRKPSSSRSLLSVKGTTTKLKHPPPLRTTKSSVSLQQQPHKPTKLKTPRGQQLSADGDGPKLDLINLQTSTTSDFKVLSHKKTQRLISADISCLVPDQAASKGEDSTIIKGRQKHPPRISSSDASQGDLI